MEWILGTFGAVLFLCGLAFLALQGFREQDEPAAVSFSVDEIVPTRGTYLVRFTAHNHGSRTLADVQISARVFDGDEPIELARAQIDFLPGDSTRSGGVFLQQDPARHRLEIRAEGFQDP